MSGRRTALRRGDGLLLGGHLSAAGGLHRAVERGANCRFTAIQLFLKSPTQWAVKPLTGLGVERFQRALASSGISSVVAHDAYLINLASPDPELRERSIDAMLGEMDRAALLGIHIIVSHLGAHMGAGEQQGLDTLAASLNQIADARPNTPVKIALETTAGQGTTLGARFEHLAYVRSRVEAPDRLRFCFDTCHVHAAGYDLVTRLGFKRTWNAFGRSVGIENLVAIHANDSKGDRGSKLDRHAHIGQGRLGLDPFRWIMNARTLLHVPKIVETPDMETMHSVNVAQLRDLARAPERERVSSGNGDRYHSR